MGLARCTCVTEMVREESGRLAINVVMVDPECGYVVHRAVAS